MGKQTAMIPARWVFSMTVHGSNRTDEKKAEDPEIV